MQAGLFEIPTQHIAYSWLLWLLKSCQLHVCSLDCPLLVQVSKKELLAVQTSKVTLNRLLARVRRLTEVGSQSRVACHVWGYVHASSQIGSSMTDVLVCQQDAI